RDAVPTLLLQTLHRGCARYRAAHPEALDPHPGAGASVSAVLPRLLVLSPHVRRDGDPLADPGRGRRWRGRLDAVESAQRLHRRRAPTERGARRQMRLLLVGALILTAALLLASYAGAESLAPT